jgi:plastocyanin
MGRLTTIAVLVAVVAGVITIAAGGVDESKKDEGKAVAEASHNPDTAPPARHVRRKVGATVPMRALAFTRRKVTIKAGETVRFRNRDNVAHDVYASLGGDPGIGDFHSPRIAPGTSYTTPILALPGTYSYVCTLHPTVMHGTIEVTA